MYMYIFYERNETDLSTWINKSFNDIFKICHSFHTLTFELRNYLFDLISNVYASKYSPLPYLLIYNTFIFMFIPNDPKNKQKDNKKKNKKQIFIFFIF